MWSIFPKWPVVLRYQNTHLNYMPRGTWVSMKHLLSLYRSVCSLLFNLCEFVQYDLYSRVRYQFKLLPPASEVWGKVMFSHLSVCPEGGWCYEGWIVLWRGGAVHNRKWHHNTPWTAPPHPLPSQQAGGRHPTGVLSCILSVKAVATRSYNYADFTIVLYKYSSTRMHSSRMRTGRSLTVCRSLLQGGVSAPGRGCLLLGGSAPGGSAPRGVCSLGGVWSRGVCSRGVSPPRGVWSQGGVCSWGSDLGGACSQGGGCLLPGGVWSWGGHLILGGVCSRGCLLWGGGIPTCTEADTPPPRGQNHRRL